MTDQYIYTSAGAVEYTLPTIVTETTGKNITADIVQVSLGTYADPGVWQSPDVKTSPTPSSVSVQILIGASLNPAPGHYYVWVKLTDSPEVPARRGPGRVVVA